MVMCSNPTMTALMLVQSRIANFSDTEYLAKLDCRIPDIRKPDNAQDTGLKNNHLKFK